MAKLIGKSFFRLYIYTNWQKIMVNHFERLYIYKLAKDNGKSFENQTDNYRQL